MSYRFAVIGLGRVGSALLELMKDSGHVPKWVVTSKASISRPKTFGAIPDRPGDADVIFITVPDGKIGDIARDIALRWKEDLKGRVFSHMSGQLTSDVLGPISKHGGKVSSLHPLQSIMDTSQAKKSLKYSYFTVEGDPEAVSVARDIVQSFGARILEIKKEHKPLYHAAAVMVSNYLVTLLSNADDIFKEIGLSMEVLLPLVRGTIENVEKYGGSALTGPIQRGDWETVKAHLEMLTLSFPQMVDLYRTLGMYTARLAGRTWVLQQASESKMVQGKRLGKIASRLKGQGAKVVFTNGCFDVLHMGHVTYLEEAKSLGDILMVGVNSDDSVRRLKGEGRPINPQCARARILSHLSSVDYVTVFDDDTPYRLIELIRPDVLVKGGDWDPADIVGGDLVRSYNGEVVTLPFHKGFSTTAIIDKIIDKIRRNGK